MTGPDEHRGEQPDELQLLRGIDPVPRPRSAFPPDHPAAKAIAEEITAMPSSTRPAAPPTVEPAGRPPSPPGRAPALPARRRSPALLAAVAAVVAVAGVAAVLAAATGGDDPGGQVAAPTTVAPTTAPSVPPTTAPVTPGGEALCIAVYDLDTLADRQLAFDGTVTAVEGDRVTFAVNEWFAGGDGDEVGLEGAGTIGTLTSNGAAVDLSPGSRLLVAGDDGFAWGCGFTQPYDEAVARQWAERLG